MRKLSKRQRRLRRTVIAKARRFVRETHLPYSAIVDDSECAIEVTPKFAEGVSLCVWGEGAVQLRSIARGIIIERMADGWHVVHYEGYDLGEDAHLATSMAGPFRNAKAALAAAYVLG